MTALSNKHDNTFDKEAVKEKIKKLQDIGIHNIKMEDLLPPPVKGNLVFNSEGKVVFEKDENGTWSLAFNGQLVWGK